MSDPMYPTHSGRVQHHAQDLTPYSAVSSFNLPAHYDSTLITPVSLTSSPAMPTKPAPALRKESEIKLSPTMSPGYHLFPDDEFTSPRFNPPMKLKDPSGILQISTADNSFPASPFVCNSPYYGSFGVSATPQSARTTNSSPAVHQSPNLQSAGGLSSSNGSRHSRQETPATSYRSSYQAPILIAPNPSCLKPATNTEHAPYRQNSLQSNQSNSSPPHSQGPPQGAFPQALSSISPRGKKRKDPPSDYDVIMQSGDINAEEQLLLQLSGRDKLPWKEVTDKFNKATGQEKKVAALQMRKKRLLERIRVWTDTETKALTLAHEEYEKGKWSSISKEMLKYGTKEKWSKEALQKKWDEMHAGEFSSEYDMMPRNRYRGSSDLSIGDFSGSNSSWSDDAESTTQSLHDSDSAVLMSALSTASMDEERNRAISNANAQIHLHLQQQQHQQQQRQQQMMFEQQRQHHHQQQRNGWNSGT